MSGGGGVGLQFWFQFYSGACINKNGTIDFQIYRISTIGEGGT